MLTFKPPPDGVEKRGQGRTTCDVGRLGADVMPRRCEKPQESDVEWRFGGRTVHGPRKQPEARISMMARGQDHGGDHGWDLGRGRERHECVGRALDGPDLEWRFKRHPASSGPSRSPSGQECGSGNGPQTRPWKSSRAATASPAISTHPSSQGSQLTLQLGRNARSRSMMMYFGCMTLKGRRRDS